MAQDQMQNNKKTEIQTIIAGHFSKNRGKIVRRSGNISISYNRVSSKDQMENGNSLSWQNEQMDLFALKNNYQITAQYGGTFESAKTDERKEFQRMLAEIKKDPSIANVLVYSYDRFSRSGANGIFLLENLRKLGVRIIAITQEVDSFTPTGMFQENLYMLISKLDNDMRKDKSMAGTKSILKKGYWPYGTPYGYDNLNKYATADKHEYVINSHGLVLRQAFKWKAEGKYSNQEILDKLRAKGLKFSLRNLCRIFSNVFYCGYVKSSLLPGELIKGKHPALIDEDLFIKANNITQQNPRSGVPKIYRTDALPLKVFVKDEISLSPFTGYHNKSKNLYYYKARDKGVRINVSATYLNNKFAGYLKKFEYKVIYKDKLKTSLIKGLEEKLQESITNKKHDSKRITELQGQIDKLEERFVLNEITKEQFEKFTQKYEQERSQLVNENDKSLIISSNLEKAVEKGLDIVQNISEIWCSSDYAKKQTLQYLIFPEGILYNKQNDTVRTTKINFLFHSIAYLSELSAENKKDNLLQDCLFGTNVGMARFELATSWSQTRRDNRATLHPELKNI